MKRKSLLILFLIFVMTLSFSQVATASQIAQERIVGDKLETARLLAEKMNNNTVESIVIASVVGYPDALSAVTLANKVDAPILYSSTEVSYSKDLLDYTTKHLDKNGTVYIMGGTGIVHADFEPRLKEMGYANIKRLGGNDRYETNMLILDELNLSENTTLVIASGDNFPDALSMSSISANKGWGILLVPKDHLLDYQKDYVTKIKPSKVYIAGGTGVVTNDVLTDINLASPTSSIERLGGLDRYETSLLINKKFSVNPTQLLLASGTEFSSLLAGSVYASQEGNPILMVDNNSDVPEAMKIYLKDIGAKNQLKGVITLGSEEYISNTTLSEVNNALQGVITKDALLSQNGDTRTYNVAISYSDLFVPGEETGNTYKVVSKHILKNEGPESGGLTFSLVLPHATQDVVQTILSETVTVDKGATVTFGKDDFENILANVEVVNLPVGEVVTVTVNYIVQLNGYTVEFDKSKLTGKFTGVSSKFLTSEDNIEVSDPTIKAQAEKLKSQSTDVWDLVQRTHTFVMDNMDYDYSLNSPYSWGGAVVALENKTGVCEDYADLEVALLRANNIPARYVVGYGLDTQRSDSPLTNLRRLNELGPDFYDLSSRRHAWVEVYLDPYGWVATDPTYGDTVPAYATVGNMQKNEHILTGIGHTYAYSYSMMEARFSINILLGIAPNKE